MFKPILISIFWTACLSSTLTAQTKLPKVKIFILAGQSNMEGKGSVVTVQRQLANPKTKDRFSHLQESGKWAVRDDVFIDYLGGAGRRYGNLTMGYGTSRQNDVRLFGPELGFGWTVGDHFDQPVLLIKTAWGGKSIDRDFRPPSRGFPDTMPQVVENRKKRNPDLTVEEYQAGYGHYYRLMIAEVKKVTGDLKTYVPNYQGQGYQLAGFVWFQGWNDQYAPTSVQDYQDNLIGFIKDVRQELDAPDLPFVIGAMGHHGEKQTGKIKQIADAQVAAAAHPDFRGSVVAIRTSKFWDTDAEAAYEKYWADKANREAEQWRNYGNDRAYHYFGSPVFFYDAGVAFGEAMIKLTKAE